MMPSTLLLDVSEWDLILDVAGNIALAAEPYALAQDAASAIKTFKAECYWDNSIGIDYIGEILARRPPLALVKQRMQNAAKTVPNVSNAVCYISSVEGRRLQGQVQVVSASTPAQVAAASFTVIDPQGAP